ncbi:hypothetical protein [Actinomycetospora sp. CA-084318]|uniref:hypothetical protein n=1 Tax=Actinomycetospora sp. CA-084318 TaxID=3239892 RepID=UPI003D97D7F2
MSQGTPQQPGADERDGAVLERRAPQPAARPTTGGPRHAPHPAPPFPPPGMPRQAPPGYGGWAPPTGGWAPPTGGWAPPTGGWAPIVEDPYDVEDPRSPGNPAAALSAVLGVLALLVSLRPLAFGSMALSWDGIVGIAIALVAVLAGAVGLRTPVRRPVAVVGMVLAVVALLVVAVLPTF